MTVTPEQLQVAGVVILILVALAFSWWLVRVAIGRTKRGQTAYWLQPDADNDPDDDDIEDDDAGVHGK
jgi:hypothetical protein